MDFGFVGRIGKDFGFVWWVLMIVWSGWGVIVGNLGEIVYKKVYGEL